MIRYNNIFIHFEDHYKLSSVYNQCFGMTPGSEAKSFNFCVSLGCIIPGHASEKSHGCLGYRMEYTLSSLIGRFTAQYGNPYEQTRTMEVTSFLVGSSDENSAVFCQAKPFIGQEIFPVIQHMDRNVKTSQAELFEKASDM